ncbi:MAG: RagB/SusD family nutrient uptake outer membrane protein, partial [Bacteroidales bacterium]|nr:RagB/SusD family nutrient uptake outer membrane protein [Bacteroidales bacterium]
NTVPEVYQQIFKDLTFAVEKLPDAPRYKGTVAKNTARLFLSKAYLTFAWWLENPKGIATYPNCDRKDLDGKSAADYFQFAYNVALDGINNPGPFALMPTFRDLFLAENDRSNTEYMLIADRTQTNEFYNGANLGYGSGPADNNAAWATTWNYELVRCYQKVNGEFLKDTTKKDGVVTKITNHRDKPIHREAAQAYGRPWTRMCPTQTALDYFTDRNKDSRYDASFITALRGNWVKGGMKNTEFFVDTIDQNPIKNGDIVVLFPREAIDGVVYPENNGESELNMGKKEGVPYWIVNPDRVNRWAHPALWKYGTYRTDNGDGLGSPNGSICRPFPICRFAELYFIAAEAAVKGASGAKSAADLINVIRERAGKWNYDNVLGEAVNEDFSSDLQVTDVDLDFILDERAREFFGESLRWYDLVRTQTWEERAGKYVIRDNNGKGVYNELKTVVREIKPHYYLRPIPQGQLDAMEMTPSEKAAFQNPGY